MLSPKRNVIKWGISDYTAFYTEGGSPALSSMSNGSVTVTVTSIKEGQYLFVWGTEEGTGALVGKFIAVATSSGLTASFKVLSGAEIGTGDGALSMLVTNSVFNIPSTDFQTDTSGTFEYNSTTNKITTTSATFNVGDVIIIMGCVTATLLPTAYFVAEIINSSTNEYRVLHGTEVAKNTLSTAILFSFTPKYCVMNLEGIDLEEIVKIEDSENGQWIPTRTTVEFENAKNDYANDGSILYYLQDKNQLFAYRGITSTQGMYLIAPVLHYLTEPKEPTPVQANA